MDVTNTRGKVASLAPLGVALFVVLNVADLVSTWVALGIGFREGNPLMSALLARFGFIALVGYKAAVIAVVCGGVLLLRRAHPRMAGVTLAACNVVVLLAVMLNVIQYQAA
ncbi:MAG TPA: DUF5658 family protein [Ktedonobacterales bacterium]|jgi:mannose/fructose/N-acetylgalactosamine-specific phosphotransferase system component IID